MKNDGIAAAKQVFRFAEFELSPKERLLTRHGVRVPLTPRIMDALILLVRDHGHVVSKEALLKKLWPDSFVEENNISQAVSALRKALGVQSNGSDFIETVPKIGFRFVAIVADDESAPARNSSDTPPAIKAAVKPRRILAAAFGAGVLAVAGFAVYHWWPVRAVVRAQTQKNVMIRLTDYPGDEQLPQYTVDGRVRFIREVDKVNYSFVMNADGGDIHRDTTVPGLTVGLWSPDQTRVFYRKAGDNKGIYVANADGTGEQKMAFSGGISMWSPDSTKIVFEANVGPAGGAANADIFIYSFTSGGLDHVIDSPAFDGDPSFSPDGSSILFVTDRDGNIEIYSKDLSSGEVRRLTVNPGHDAFPTYSPDGTQIIFSSDREKENCDVYIMNADGSDVRKVTDLPGRQAAMTNCWSRDGTSLLISSDQGGNDNIYKINIEPFAPKQVIASAELDLTKPSYSPDGAGLLVSTNSGTKSDIRIYALSTAGYRVVTKTETAATQPVFSPDGKQIAFRDQLDGNSEIFVVNTDGTSRVNISQNPAADQSPAWAPGGERIVFASNREGNLAAYGIFSMNPDGSDQRRIYYDNSFASNPTFAPDGRSILFEDDKAGGRVGNFELFSVDAETGGDEHRLTDRRRYDVHGAYSPDGKSIVFVSDLDGNSEIYVMRSDGKDLLRITRDLAADTDPQWSPDGNRIVFSSDRSGKFAIYEVSVPE